MPYTFDELFAKYPYVGMFEEWNTERGFGKLRWIGSHRLLFAHISHRDGPRSRGLQLNGRKCLFTLGYIRRSAIQIAVISWITDDHVIGNFDKYLAARKRAVASWSHGSLAAAIKATWYVDDIWKGDPPQKRLPQDLILLDEVERRLSNPIDPNEYLTLLHAKVQSPFFSLSEGERRNELRASLARLAKAHSDVFRKCSTDQLSSFLSSVPLDCAEVIRPVAQTVFSRLAVALDVESDGEDLFQVGYAQEDQARLTMVRENSIVSANNAARAVASVVRAQWMVGHNVLSWDLPILKQCFEAQSSTYRVLKSLSDLKVYRDRYNNPFSRDYAIWDTLIISALLEPWKSSHALTTSITAHRADSDAVATRKLFQEQVDTIPLDYSALSAEPTKFSPAVLLDHCAAALPKIDARNYPKAPSFLNDISHSTSQTASVILPEMLLSYCGWVPGVRYLWPEGYVNQHHFSLPAQKFADALATTTSVSVFNKLLLHLLRDAEAHNVQVLVDMLPHWLRRECGDLIEKCATPSADFQGEVKWNLCTYESCRPWTVSAQRMLAESHKFAPELASLSLLEVCDELSAQDCKSIIPLGPEIELSYQLRRLTDDQIRKLRGTTLNPKGVYWLEYHPARKKLVKPWQLWLSRGLEGHNWPEGESPPGEFSSGGSGLFIRPRWLDGNTGGPVSIDGLWPTSANRAAYWRDLISQLLSLRQHSDPSTHLLLLLENNAELHTARRLFAELNMASAEDTTIAQQLLAGKSSRSLRYSVDLLKNLPTWRNTSLELGYRLCFVVESIPLSQWLMCCNQNLDQPQRPNDLADGNEDAQAEDQDDETAEDRFSLLAESPTPIFTTENIGTCLDLFLEPWLRANFGDDVPVILDSRLRVSGGYGSLRGRVEEVVWQSLDRLQADIFDRYKDEFGEFQRKAPPLDYAAYEKFLDDHWRDHKDPGEQPWQFKSDTQKPAIEAICQAEGDLLVRLPTGEGKSVIFQVPALLRGFCTQKLTLVISPLRALMRDQVAFLWKKGFFTSVDYLSADRETWEISEVYQGILDNRIKLLYIAPERFRAQRFREVLDRRHCSDDGLEFIVIDETHCVSQWGFDFRPDYFYALEEIKRMYRSGSPPVRVLMFSATVTRAVEGDLRDLLDDENRESFLVRPEAYRHPIQSYIRINLEEVPVGLYGEGRTARIYARTGEIQRFIRDANPDSRKSVVLVFVSRRDHAEAIAEFLAKDLPQRFRVEYFHAGMPPGERLRVYESVKRCGVGGTNVLVATKAFGMGMDIPNIHWCVHLAPPAYLEDYLQEVGRTGRGSKERAAVGLDIIDCTLLHHSDDFARNHELVRRNMIQPHDLVLLWGEVLRRSAITSTGKHISILPTDGYGEMNGDRLRRGLSWLEREPSRRLSILGYLPGMLRISLNRELLEQYSKTDGARGAVAKAILRLYHASSETPVDEQAQPSETQGGVWSFLKKYIGFLFSNPEREEPMAPHEAQACNPPAAVEKAEIHLGALLSESGLANADELYRTLFSLQQTRAIHIERYLVFKEGSAIGMGAQVWKWVAALVDELVGRAYERGREVVPEEMMQVVYETIQPEGPATQKMRSNAEAVVRAVVRLINASGLRVREQLNEERKLVYQYTLPKIRLKALNRRIRSHLGTTRRLQALLEKAGKATINLGNLLKLLDTKRRLRDLRTALRLLSDLGLYSSEQSLFCYSYILEINTTNPLPDKSAHDLEASDLQMYNLLDRVNRFSELRSFATAMFSRLPTPEERRQFIEDYFQAGSPRELEDMLGTAVGNIDDPVIPEELKQILGQVRQEAIQRSLDKFRLGDEPAQYDVCCHPWDRNLQVNAGPGAGKTEVLMMRAAHLIHQQGLRPEQVLILAFNRAVVHEIRARIKHLFDGLGYGAYVRRLQVRTFHAFALEHISKGNNRTPQADESLDAMVAEFCRQCATDLDFARSVITGVRAILVDEFQDMNESRYGLLNALVNAANEGQHHSNLGIMVIGDDDQDILRWDRKENPVEARDYFSRFCKDFAPVDVLDLKVNFRSSKRIVDRTQNFLNKILSPVSDRIKNFPLQARRDPSPGIVQDRCETDPETLKRMLRDSQENDETCAILCRTNYEALRLHQSLSADIPGVQIQGRDKLELSRLRHIGTWLDGCRRILEESGDQQLDDVLLSRVRDEYERSGIPEAKDPRGEDALFLWDAALEENPRATLSYYLAFVDELGTDDYIRLLGKTEIPKWIERRNRDGTGRVLISTIHKVKGLEFDTVIILPSKTRFNSCQRKEDAARKRHQADEMRLFYVAMTRAKRNLAFSLGPREDCWIKGKEYEAAQGGIYIEGNPTEVWIDWPGFDDGLQEYIRTRVNLDDRLNLERRQKRVSLRHGMTQIGFLSESLVRRLEKSNITNADIRVLAVYRYRVNHDTSANFVNQLTERCRLQGWFYTVLVNGLVT